MYLENEQKNIWIRFSYTQKYEKSGTWKSYSERIAFYY